MTLELEPPECWNYRHETQYVGFIGAYRPSLTSELFLTCYRSGCVLSPTTLKITSLYNDFQVLSSEALEGTLVTFLYISYIVVERIP